MIKGIHHNVYRCRDSEETRRFYEEFLGVPLVAAMEIGAGRGLHTFYALGDGSFLAFFEVPNQPFEFKEQDQLDLHIALEVELTELDSWLEKANAAGLSVRGITDHEVVRSFYVHDPNGYVIELTARTPVHERLRDPIGAHDKLDVWQAAKRSTRPRIEPVVSPA
jgi:catechol 2,3-dioxygenase-like lactoylglutathione lyase family enzyme